MVYSSGRLEIKKTNNNQHILIWGILMLVVLGVTIGIFVSFRPIAARYSYWIAMADLCLIEIVSGTYLFYNLLVSSKRMTSKIPVAMHISIGTTVGIFFLVTLVIVLTFLFAFNRSDLDMTFLWIVIGKWVLLLIVVGIMWFTGHEGREEKVIQEQSREARTAVSSRVNKILTELHRLPTSSEEAALKRQVVDEFEILNNRLRSQVSTTPGADAGWNLDSMLDALESDINSLGNASESERKEIMVRIHDSIRKMS